MIGMLADPDHRLIFKANAVYKHIDAVGETGPCHRCGVSGECSGVLATPIYKMHSVQPKYRAGFLWTVDLCEGCRWMVGQAAFIEIGKIKRRRERRRKWLGWIWREWGGG